MGATAKLIVAGSCITRNSFGRNSPKGVWLEHHLIQATDPPFLQRGRLTVPFAL